MDFGKVKGIQSKNSRDKVSFEEHLIHFRFWKATAQLKTQNSQLQTSKFGILIHFSELFLKFFLDLRLEL